MLALIYDHWIVTGCVIAALAGAAWLSWEFMVAPLLAEEDYDPYF